MTSYIYNIFSFAFYIFNYLNLMVNYTFIYLFSNFFIFKSI